MPTTTVHPNYQGSSPTQGRTIKSITGGCDRAGSADAAADVLGFGYSNPAGDGSVRCVDPGQVWAVELDPTAPDVNATGIQLMVTANGLHKGKVAGDTGLSIGASTSPPAGVPPRNATITFSSGGRKYVWVTCAPHVET